MPSEVYLNTANVALMEEEQIPYTPENSVVRSVLTGNDITRGLAEDIFNNASYRAGTVFRYGRDHYIHGLPKSTFASDQILEDEVQDILEAAYGTPLTIQYHNYGDYNGLHHAWQRIIDDYSYDPDTNKLPDLKTTIEPTIPAPVYPETAKVMSDVYLENLVYFTDVTVTGDEPDPNPVGAILGTSPTNRFIPWSNSQAGQPSWGAIEGAPYIVLFYTYKVTTTTETSPGVFEDTDEFFYEDVTVTADPIPDGDAYFQTYFTYNGDHYYWIYGTGEGTYPELDAADDNTLGDDHSFMPMVIFRNHEQHWAAEANENDPQHISATKLMKKMGYSYQELGDQILENPSISDIEQAAFIYAIPTGTTDQDSLAYLHAFFKWFGSTDPNNLGVAQTAPSVSRISEALIDLAYSHTGIYSESVAGTIGDIDFVTEQVVDATQNYTFYTPGFGGGNFSVPSSNYIYEKQIAPNLIDRVTIRNLSLSYKISRKYRLSVDNTSGKTLIPINFQVMLDNFNVNERENIYSRSEHMVFNSKVTVEVEWYETGVFKFLLAVVAVAVIIVTWGTTSAFVSGVYSSILAAVGGAVIVAVLLTAVFLIAMNVVIEYGFSLIADALGPKYTLYLAVIALVVSFFLPTGNVWADRLVFASNNLVDAANSEFEELANKYSTKLQEFELFAKDKYDELEKLQAELDGLYNEDVIDSLVMVPLFIPGESPDQYFGRTIETTNVGTAVYDLIEYHAEIGLELPTFSDSVGNDYVT